MMSFHEKIQKRMRETGKSYYECCKELGSAGGRRTAEKKRMAKEKREKFHAEQLNQVARGMRDADEIPDNLNDLDRANIAMDQAKRRVA